MSRFTTKDLVDAILKYRELTLPPGLREGKPTPTFHETDAAQNRAVQIAETLKAQADEGTQS